MLLLMTRNKRDGLWVVEKCDKWGKMVVKRFKERT